MQGDRLIIREEVLPARSQLSSRFTLEHIELRQLPCSLWAQKRPIFFVFDQLKVWRWNTEWDVGVEHLRVAQQRQLVLSGGTGIQPCLVALQPVT